MTVIAYLHFEGQAEEALNFYKNIFNGEITMTSRYGDAPMPVDVHVSSAEYESKLELEFENGKLKKIKSKNVKGRFPLPSKEMREAIKFVRKYYEGIVEKWTTFFVKNKKVSCEIITKKIK